ncbi:alanine racemase [Curtobacterium oceanosedimentum]|uniref:alanine racemase n=1 Tax=Curtobacterium oceanosedimentum TaxID=465820 RepID=UPI001CE20F01|nr:alanine racemase [Curtobacterium oceanosedimentum]MCA5923892.1 alanine racemase [Curtobacterium oceanosedimentum]
MTASAVPRAAAATAAPGTIGSPAAPVGPLRTVHPDAIAANVRRVTARGHDLIAVVKADGYGHGSVTVARTALAAGASALGTATLPEALALRDAGIDARVLCWLHLPGADFDAAALERIEIAVGDLATLTAVAAAGRRTGTPVAVHLHIDTGMAREGAEPDHWQALLDAAAAAERSGHVRTVAVMGHVPGADRASAARAATLLRLAALAADRTLGHPVDLHLGGTPAAFAGADLRGIAVRVGAALVGIGPADAGLVGAMTVTAPVVAVRTVRAGTPVGYDGTWTAPTDAVLAVLPVGYADGVPRAASGSARARVRGRIVPVVGRINMDQVVLDVTGLPVARGETVTLLGGAGPTPGDWARWAGTNAHEIVTGIGGRIGRTVAPATTTPTTTRSTT